MQTSKNKKSGKLFGLINIIDLAILLCIVLAAIILAPKFLGSSPALNIGTESKTVYFTLELSQTDPEFSKKIAIGDSIRDNQRGYYYGVVDDVKTIPSETIVHNLEDGTFILTPVPDLVDVHITVKCNGTESDTEISAEGQPMKLGKMLILKGKGYVAAGYIISLRT